MTSGNRPLTTPGSSLGSLDYCPGCGRSEYAGITHVCPPIPAAWAPQTEATRTVSTIPTFFDFGVGTVTTGGETSA